ncbi:MAG: hypothetical protein ACOYD0_11520 [Candidatus Nanopelagicales bacterium]
MTQWVVDFFGPIADELVSHLAPTRTEVDVAFADAAHWRTWTMSVGQRAMWQAVSVEKMEEVHELAAERLSHCMGADGQIHLTQTIRTTVARPTEATE